MTMFLFKAVTQDARAVHGHFQRANTNAREIIHIAFLGALAAVLQSAGGLLPGIGYIISPLATAPMLMAAVYSIRSGITAYFLTIILLLVLQPSELAVFPFTTGLLGLVLGAAFIKLEKRIGLILAASASLFAGIAAVLYGLRFPLLGPSVSTSIKFTALVYIYLFCFVYAFIWVELGIVILRKFRRMLSG
ncbi:hypothetical protein [Paenibacillus alkalitolerans]|uniref:hypothetical protein n=1 Tax=Paenibacillus alkalitolerans TaxID=2799335 RepID=UPI0018F5CD50|nr:hypothetical protein [Paenibacillus alkalitolerans]